MILVAGGPGTLGAALVPRLVERNLPVRVLTRAGLVMDTTEMTVEPHPPPN
ncbi:MAG: hypothetical protein ABJC60_09670 [Actinomycetota bacterium]